jgi:5-(carboxyamino)imidazole ribonucleotide mutase
MKVALVMGSKSDAEIVSPAVAILKKFGVETEARVLSAHRTPDEAAAFSKDLRKNGFEAVIAAAGKSAHLAGVVAAFTTLPVIALPVQTSMMGGLDSLLSMVQMPSGVPVACVAVNGGENAGLLALQILGVKYPELAKKLENHKKEMRQAVLADDKSLKL